MKRSRSASIAPSHHPIMSSARAAEVAWSATASSSGANAPGTPVGRFDRRIGTYMDAQAAEPAFARLFMIEVYSGGEKVLRALREPLTELVRCGLGADRTTGRR